ncbi:DUF6049 family protein [Nocardioides antri]|uniref:Uncharacterized protein n=1 Tax=Nocardioides antri TaxID=2607659 RepID=A0A5B1M0Q9_9ACTN|nr:DUF6049 family protein [Nocardioides antri]KAA1426755.1 hypothetical protein F0U47_12350 [Nocardioides antri]
MVLRPLVLRASVGVVATLAAGLMTSAPATAAVPDPARDHLSDTVPATYDAPLLVTIDDLTPGEVPDRGPVVVTGSVINRDVETWTGVALYPFINAGDCPACPPPITTAAELVAAAETDPDALVGNRIVDVSAQIDSLAPGEVATYSIRIPRRLLPVTSPGIYWFGVHALGASESKPDDEFADGRARTFLPYVPRGRDGIRGQVDTAVVVPLRFRVQHRQNGALARPQEWLDAYEPIGELGGPLAFGSAAFGQSVSWLVDPAVLDAVRRLRRGNPPRDLGPEPSDADEDGDGESESPAEGAKAEAEEDETQENDPVAEASGEWLDSVEVALRGEEVLALPYGDIDMSATPEWMPALYPLSRERAGDVLSSWETETEPVVASPGGYLDPSGIPSIDDDSTLLVTDRMFEAPEFRRGAPVVGEYDDHAIVATSYGAATGGPGPEPRLSPVSFRQRVLSEAALRLIGQGPRHPLVVMVPRTIDSAGAAAFWSGLDASWLNLTTLADATDRPRTPVEPDALSYPEDQETAELDSTVFYEAERLIDSGATLQNLLTEAERTASDVRDEALTGASYHFRTEPTVTADRLSRSRTWIDRRLRSVVIEGPPGVTLSGADGTFAVTVTNNLDRPVTVHLVAESEDDRVSVDVGDPVVLAADSRTTLALPAHARRTGVHNVTLSVTDVDGTPLGSSAEVPIRSGQVSEVIWVIIGSGVGILFVAIGLRLFRRIRRHRRASTPSTSSGTATTEGMA